MKSTLKLMLYCLVLLWTTQPALAEESDDTQNITPKPTATLVNNPSNSAIASAHPAVSVEHTPPVITPYQIPTFTGEPVDWHKTKPAINPKKKINGDAIFQIINRCYPLKSGFGLEVSLRSGVNYKPSTNNSTTVQTYDSQSYYAGIVANMPLYSDVEIDKDRKLEYQRRMQTTDTIKTLLSAVAAKRRADRMMGLYASLEQRAQARIENGIASVDEQIGYLEKVATTQGELDKAEAEIESSRLALVGQCRPEVVDEVNGYILSEIE